jgi:hypothetical protein
MFSQPNVDQTNPKRFLQKTPWRFKMASVDNRTGNAGAAIIFARHPIARGVGPLTGGTGYEPSCSDEESKMKHVSRLWKTSRPALCEHKFHDI